MSPEFPAIVCLGEALTDMIRNQSSEGDIWHSRVGGSTWNVARAVRGLGLPCGFGGAVSQDIFGQALQEASAKAGLDLRFLQPVNKAPLLAMVVQSHPPEYFFIGEDSADLYFTPASLPQGWQSAVKWAHFGGISLARQPLADCLVKLAQELKAAGVKISYDPNFRNLMDEHYDRILLSMTQLADVIKVSDEDLRGLFRTNDTDAAFSSLRLMNPDAAILYTCGADGASIHAGEQGWHTPSPAIRVVDTVGAGDASMAGLLYSLSQQPQRSWQQHLHFAVASGSAACLAAGAHAPQLEQVKNLFDSLESLTTQSR